MAEATSYAVSATTRRWVPPLVGSREVLNQPFTTASCNSTQHTHNAHQCLVLSATAACHKRKHIQVTMRQTQHSNEEQRNGWICTNK